MKRNWAHFVLTQLTYCMDSAAYHQHCLLKTASTAPTFQQSVSGLRGILGIPVTGPIQRRIKIIGQRRIVIPISVLWRVVLDWNNGGDCH